MEKIYVPDYYKNFQCIAGQCKHTCCAGWEIDIDEDSLERYKAMEGEVGERIRSRICFKPEDEACSSKVADSLSEDGARSGNPDEFVPHFILKGSDKCPFLQDDGLCELILAEGEDILCQICTDHPRFRNFWEGRVEVGLGLACEEAARIILGRKDPMRLVELHDGGEAGYGESVDDTSLASSNANSGDAGDWNSNSGCGDEANEAVDGYSELPPDEQYLMSVRDELFEEARNIENPMVARLAEYLIFRYIANALYDDMLDERIAFVEYCIDQVTGLWAASEDQSFETLCDIVRDWSSKLEYNEELIAEIMTSLQN